MSKEVFFRYQRKWLQSRTKHQFREWVKSRQIGGSFTIAFEGLMEAIENRHDVLFCSASERQVKHLGRKVKKHIDVAKQVTGKEILLKKDSDFEIFISGGGNIFCLPANPSTVQGFTGAVFLDEFDWVENDFELYTALLPSITRGNFPFTLVSTFNPYRGKTCFKEVFKKENNFFKQVTPLDEAIEDGVRVNKKAIREAMSEDMYAAVYDCQLISGDCLFPEEEIDKWMKPVDIWNRRLPEILNTRGSIWMGVDIGRRRHLTAAAVIKQIADEYFLLELDVLHKMKFREQRKRLIEKINKWHPQRVCIDETGIGMQLAEELKELFPITVEGVMFSGPVKSDIVTFFQIVTEDRRLHLQKDEELKKDIHGIQKIETAAGNIRYDAKETEDGHSDRFWALGLGLHASDSSQTRFVPGIDPIFVSLGR